MYYTVHWNALKQLEQNNPINILLPNSWNCFPICLAKVESFGPISRDDRHLPGRHQQHQKKDTNMAATQDMPPPGGFPSTIRYARYLPSRGPSGALILTGTLAITGYGWYWLSKSHAERRELRREKAWSRIALVPFLQAETDRDLVRRLQGAKNREAQVMSNVKDWAPLDLKAPVQGLGKRGSRDSEAAEPVYHTKAYVAPSVLFLPPTTTIGAQWWRGTKLFSKVFYL